MTPNVSRARPPEQTHQKHRLFDLNRTLEISSQDLQVTLAAVGVKVHVSAIRATSNKLDLHRICARKSSTSPISN